ncbi:MAG TPA: aminotransferase class III-fold pyridoxal phosphate-dependent enzyme [Solirubrobacteraceae bacterium]|nr:aminotransferase class III-fold pyridoxal phosphate-dependent enzyme [Solirubrobacteraceae bacterium]
MTSGSSPGSDALYERALRSLPGGNSRTTVFVPPHPPYALRGEGWRVWDVDGHELIDLQCNYTSLVHGHAFAPVVRAAGEALAAGSAFGLPTAAEVQLAECLTGRVRWTERWRFASSGSEAVMMAVRAARAASGRELLVRFAGCYHGSWDAVVPANAPGLPSDAQRDVVTLPFGDADALNGALERHGERVACVLLDPLPSRLGLRAVQPAFATLLREQTRRRGIALILDEVVSFRLGIGGMQELYGIEADLVALGKLIGGGLPIGALGGRAELMDVFDPRRPDAVGHGGTFSANPVSMYAGLAALAALDAAAIARIDTLGERLRAGLRELDYDVRGQGSLAQVAVADPAELWWRLYRAGVLIAGRGLMCVSTAMDEAVIDRALNAFARAAG